MEVKQVLKVIDNAHEDSEFAVYFKVDEDVYYGFHFNPEAEETLKQFCDEVSTAINANDAFFESTEAEMNNEYVISLEDITDQVT